MSPNTQNTTTLTYIKLLYKLIQCLHHITIIQQQQNGSFTKAFAQKLRSLNDFVKPANSGPQFRTKIEEINKYDQSFGRTLQAINFGSKKPNRSSQSQFGDHSGLTQSKQSRELSKLLAIN